MEIQKSKHSRYPDFVPKANEKEIKYCECSCGNQIPFLKTYKYKGWPRFISSHNNNLRKGKTNEELFGKEKAEKMGKKPEGFGAKVSAICKGKSYEERFGKERADEIKEYLHKAASRKYEEKFSPETAQRMREVARQNINKVNEERIWTREEVLDKIKEIYKTQKLKRYDISTNATDYGLPAYHVIKKLFGGTEELRIAAGIEYIEFDRSEYLKENPFWDKNNPATNKGTLEEKYGEEKAKEIKNNMSQARIEGLQNGTIEPWNKGTEGLQEAWNKGMTKFDHPSIMIYAKARTEYLQTHTGNFISSQEDKVSQFLTEKGINHERQYYIENIEHSYVSDFYIPEYNLVIEIDGIYWHNKPGRKERDEIRNKELLEKGYNVLRFTDKEVDKKFLDVKYYILDLINKEVMKIYQQKQ